MLNLLVAMLRLYIVFTFVFVIWMSGPGLVRASVPEQKPALIEVSSPSQGEALQGVIQILGSTDLTDFSSSEVSFGYVEDPTSTWFLIEQSSEPVEDGLIASWDTSTITDGEYRLRVQVFLTTGLVQEIIIDDLRVRNYTLIETSTPDPEAERVETLQVTPSLPSEFQAASVSPTPLPTNPVQITVQDLQKGAFQGVAVVMVALAAGGVYSGFRFLFRRR
jgi:hypothetical protein